MASPGSGIVTFMSRIGQIRRILRRFPRNLWPNCLRLCYHWFMALKTNTATSKASVRKPAAQRHRKSAVAMTNNETEQRVIDTETISRLAYSLWEERGREDGSPEQDWLEAERELREKR